MKKYLIQLNRPLLIRVEDPENYQSVYGFLARYDEDNDLKNKEMKNNIRYYVGYLAALSLFSSGADDFTIDFSNRNSPDWKDKEGVVHMHHDDWMKGLEKEAVKKLNLSYTLHVIDLDEHDDEFADCIACGTIKGNICCSKLMDRLVRMAEEQKGDAQYGVVLFNRPIFLPKRYIWKGEPGYCHLYGLLHQGPLDSVQLDDASFYLGYLAMNEYLFLEGETPSGFTVSEKDDRCWDDEYGNTFSAKSDEILDESLLCKERSGLKIYYAVLNTPRKYIETGVRDEFIIDLDLYESLLEPIQSDE